VNGLVNGLERTGGCGLSDESAEKDLGMGHKVLLMRFSLQQQKCKLVHISKHTQHISKHTQHTTHNTHRHTTERDQTIKSKKTINCMSSIIHYLDTSFIHSLVCLFVWRTSRSTVLQASLARVDRRSVTCWSSPVRRTVISLVEKRRGMGLGSESMPWANWAWRVCKALNRFCQSSSFVPNTTAYCAANFPVFDSCTVDIN